MLFYHFFLLCLNVINSKYFNGLLIYNYKKMKYYYPTTVNIGDYIQSLAAEQYLKDKKNIIYLDRDNLKKYNGKKVKLLLNCFYKINYKTKIISQKILPLFISFHINNQEKIYLMKKTLKKYEPIGARDFDTMFALQKNGIKSYYSSCLTLTLGKNYKSIVKKNIIYLVDYIFNKNVLLDLEVIKILKFYQPDEVKFLYHEKIKIKTTTQKERFDLAKLYLKKYSQAILVITRRLHAALPCVGMDVPVILFNINKKKEPRFSGYTETFVNFMGYYSNTSKFRIEILTDEYGYVTNDEQYKYYVDKMENVINNFFNCSCLFNVFIYKFLILIYLI